MTMNRKTDDTRGLSSLFHLNSEPWLNEQPDPVPRATQKVKSYPDADRIALPETDPGRVDELAAARRSVRAFRDEPLPLTGLAALLRAGYAALGPDRLASGQHLLRRPVPSAGGLYPLEMYLLVRNVEGLTTGLYHYDTVGDALELLCEDSWEARAERAFLTWSFMRHAPVIVCIGAVFDRTQDKYGPRGYRYILLEAGHVAQNLCLAAQENGLSTLCVGGYRDGILNRLFSLDERAEGIVYSVACGVAE